MSGRHSGVWHLTGIWHVRCQKFWSFRLAVSIVDEIASIRHLEMYGPTRDIFTKTDMYCLSQDCWNAPCGSHASLCPRPFHATQKLAGSMQTTFRFVCVLLITIIGIFAFTSGFLLSKAQLKLHSPVVHVPTDDRDQYKAPFSRALVLVLDALRLDFIVEQPYSQRRAGHVELMQDTRRMIDALVRLTCQLLNMVVLHVCEVPVTHGVVTHSVVRRGLLLCSALLQLTRPQQRCNGWKRCSQGVYQPS